MQILRNKSSSMVSDPGPDPVDLWCSTTSTTIRRQIGHKVLVREVGEDLLAISEVSHPEEVQEVTKTIKVVSHLEEVQEEAEVSLQEVIYSLDLVLVI